jgi:predicted SprT family Zn-dependent metalloprotease
VGRSPKFLEFEKSDEGVKRTHCVDRSGLARRQRRFVLCDCPKDTKCRIGVRLFNAMRRGGEFRCTKCGLKLDRKAAVEEDRMASSSEWQFT